MIEVRETYITLFGYIVALIALVLYIHYQLKALVKRYHEAPKEEEAPAKDNAPASKDPPARIPRPKRATKKDDPDTVLGVNKINTILSEMILDQDFDKIDALGEAVVELSELADRATIEKYLRKIKLT